MIFPNRCEVIEIEASQRYIYPIFKNGSSSLIEHARQQNYKILINEQIKRAPIIDVTLRDPLPRYISGIQTFVHDIKKENPTDKPLQREVINNHLDWLCKNYQFLSLETV